MYGFADGVKYDTINNLNQQEKRTAVYFIDLPAGLDTMDFHSTITLDVTKSYHKLKLPNGGTETNVLIYDSTYLKNIQNNTIPKAHPLAKGDFLNNKEVLLDVTSLPRGKYYIHYLSCNLGGVFSLTIM